MEKIKNSIRIQYVNNAGDKKEFYSEEQNKSNIDFLGTQIGNFLLSIGIGDEGIRDIMESIDYKISTM